MAIVDGTGNIHRFFWASNLEAAILDTARKKSSFAIDDDSSPMVEQNTIFWGAFLVGIVIGFVAVYIVVAQPMFAQLGQLQRQMAAFESDLQPLVGNRNQAWQT